ncbi:sensor histidine kinase [Halomicronema hongdechloris]|nr:HAMP domain-containing histidine kinase [Halomicronema hongdechloris]
MVDQDIQRYRLAYGRALEQAQFQGGFLARTSHELRSPINRVISLHQMILEDLCDSPEEEREFLQQAQTATQEVLALLDQLTAISKLQIGAIAAAIQPVCLQQLFSEVQQLTQLQVANRNCRFSLELPPTEVYGLSDPIWLRQALVMLIEICVANDSRQIALRLVSAPTAPSLILQLDHDCPDSKWQEPSELWQQWPQRGPAILSPGLRLGLALQVLQQVQARVCLDPPRQDTPGGARLQIHLANGQDQRWDCEEVDGVE